MMTLKEMALCLGSNPQDFLPDGLAGREPAQFCLDSRKAGPGDVFICMTGDNADGHAFAGQAAERGALAVIAERDPFAGQTPPLAVLRVENSLAAITRLASVWRDQTRARVVGVTGTAGKTSVKEVLASVLERHGKTAKNFMNMNNQLGLPVSMLNAPADADFWVMEVGISAARDMDELGGLLRPDLAIILNVGPGHVSGLGDRGVAHYKARLLNYVRQPDSLGRALINADYPDLLRESRAYAVPQSLFSTRRGDVDYHAAYLGPATAASGRYQVSGLSLREFEVAAPFRGSFGSENVAAIAGAAHLLGLSPDEIAAGLPLAAMPRQRFSCQTYKNTVLIDDSYNSNPLSADRMLESAAEMAREKKLPLFLVMGEMLELGDVADEGHVQLGKSMAGTGAGLILWKGGRAERVREGLEQGGYDGEFLPVDSVEDFSAAVGEAYKKKGCCGVMFFKGSRGNRLERFVQAFQNEFCANM